MILLLLHIGLVLKVSFLLASLSPVVRHGANTKSMRVFLNGEIFRGFLPSPIMRSI
jgi:hypothetical protein